MLLLWLKRSYGVGNLMTITFWVLLRNVSFVFTSFLLKNGQNLNFRIFGQHFFNFCSLFGYLMFILFMNLYSCIHIYESAIIKFFARWPLWLRGCVARIADFGPSDPSTNPGECIVESVQAIMRLIESMFYPTSGHCTGKM